MLGLLLTGLLLAALPGAARAQGLALNNLVVDNSQGDILVRFGVEVEEPSPVEQMLTSGQSLEFVCQAALYRVRTVWPDKTVAREDLRLIITYDVLQSVYTARDKEGKELVVESGLTAFLDKIMGSVVMDLGPWSDLKRDKNYSLRLSIALTRNDVPPWLRKALFFWGWDAAPQADYQLDFSY